MISELHNRHVKEIFKGSSIAFVLKIIGFITGYIFTFLISIYYGAKGVGMYSLSFTVLSISGMLGALGTQTSILRFVGQFSAENSFHKIRSLYKKILMLVIPSSLIIAFTLFFFSETIARSIFHNESLAKAFMIISLSIPFFVMNSVHVEMIRGMKIIKFSEYLRSANTTFFSAILIFSMHFFVSNYYLPIAAFAASIGLTFIFSTSYVIRKMNTFPKQGPDSLSSKDLLKTSLPMMMTAFSFLLMGNITIIMLGMYATTQQVGIYTISLKIASITSFVLIAVNTIAAPKFSELYWSQRTTDLRRVVESTTKLAFSISTPILLAIVLFPEFFLSLFGKEFVLGKYATIILAMGQFVSTASGSVGYFLSMTGGQNALRNIIISGMVLNIVLNAMLIPRYGINGAALSTMISMSFWNVTSALYIKVKNGIRTYYIPFFPRKRVM